MIVLGLDTSTVTSGIAIVDGDRLLADGRHDASARHADLLVAVDGLCRRAGVAPAQLDAVAIGAGPGSFTGLRIGMATAKGIAFAARRPLWAVSSLAALGHDAAAVLDAAAVIGADHAGAVIAAVIDARRGEVFAGCFRGGAPLGEERVLAPEAVAAWTEELAAGAPVRYAGDALAVYPALAPLTEQWLTPAAPSGAAVAWLALAGPRQDVLTSGAPSYIRPSEAEVMYPDGVPGALRRR
ncbi:MAG TPA: tRNA (adenosine(37)-N6)-threonylcarbamoyltransferase complex dimerization subunit type 1 TsaB [Kofleriaceae bacterium]|nr:tRNA (adenosine(37)-N6)-threonylcarbamoyltransferase complex dimerization subunit type 1 TsaB [Kofleriaceae bacterium]